MVFVHLIKLYDNCSTAKVDIIIELYQFSISFNTKLTLCLSIFIIFSPNPRFSMVSYY